MRVTARQIFISIVLFFSISVSFAELHRPNRYFEVSEEVEVSATNNYFKLQDYIGGKIKDFDFEEMANDLSDEGWDANANFKEMTQINFNHSNFFRIGVFAGVEGNGHVDAGKTLFKYLAYDTDQIPAKLKSIPQLQLASWIAAKDIDSITNVLGLPSQNEVVKVGGYVDVIASTGASFYTTLLGIGINIKPTYYVPVIHVPKTTATASYSITDDGLLKAEANATLKVYTAFDLKYFDKDLEYSNSEKRDHILKNLSNGGAAIDVELEHNFFDKVDFGIFGQIPVTPGKLKYLASTTAYAYYTVDLLKEVQGIDSKDNDYDIGKRTYSNCSKKFYRPLRAGQEMLLHPTEWFGIYEKANIVLRNPYDKDERVRYYEYDAGFIVSGGNVIKLTLGTAYENEVFYQKLGLGLNFRIVEVNVRASLCGEDFVKSFNGKGAGAYVGVKVGF